jgi:feruloyl esterase
MHFLYFWALCALPYSNALATELYGASFQSDCAALPSLLNQTTAPNTTFYFSKYIPGGTNVSLADVNPSCLAQLAQNGGSQSLPVTNDVCRVGGYTATSNQSGIQFELWLPRSWSGRFVSHGNGGVSGCITKYSVDGKHFLMTTQALIILV